jgi:hypothetical protein
MSIDLGTGRGLEVGPLYTPLVRRPEADVRYTDVYSTEELRSHYRDDPAVSIEDIVDVDYPLIDGDIIRTVAGAAAEGAPFDWVLASHVIEHVPDLIGWLADLASIMADGARLGLVVPDGRFSFDAIRPVTTVGEMVLAHASGDTRPSLRAVFDHFDSHRTVNVVELWDHDFVPGEDRMSYTSGIVNELMGRTRSGEYIDSHVWVFTPVDFVRQLDILSRYGYLDFAFVEVMPTARHDLEFYATLERLPRSWSDEEKRARFESNLEDMLARAASGEPAGPPPALVPSPREERLIVRKRAIATRLRRLRRS